MKTLLEIQALQSLGSSESNSTPLTTGSSIFSDMIEELMSESPENLTSAPNTLGSVSSHAQLTHTQTTDATADRSYLSAFLYSKDLASSFDTTKTAPIEQYLSTDYIGQTAYNDLLSGAEKYADIIAKASAKYDVPEKLLASVMKQESNFNPTITSTAGAQGLMQLMPSTARYLGVTDSTDPQQNIMGGAKYLRQMLDQFDNNISTALAAYNAGPGNVRKYGGIPPFKETTNYVKKVMNYYQV